VRELILTRPTETANQEHCRKQRIKSEVPGETGHKCWHLDRDKERSHFGQPAGAGHASIAQTEVALNEEQGGPSEGAEPVAGEFNVGGRVAVERKNNYLIEIEVTINEWII
jgi:hypothetical protein